MVRGLLAISCSPQHRPVVHILQALVPAAVLIQLSMPALELSCFAMLVLTDSSSAALMLLLLLLLVLVLLCCSTVLLPTVC